MKQLQSKAATHPLFLIAMELDSPDDRAPLLELVDPVVQRGLGDDNHVGAVDASVLMQVPQQGDGLQSLAQSLQMAQLQMSMQMMLPLHH